MFRARIGVKEGCPSSPGETPSSTPFGDPPAWVADAVIYQIFPDRFRRSGQVKAQRHLELKPWGSDPREHVYPVPLEMLP